MMKADMVSGNRQLAELNESSEPGIEQTLRARARRLAQVPSQTNSDAMIEVLSVRLGAEQYAVELSFLRAVLRPAGLTPVPCTPPHVAGVLNLRGELISVLDLPVVLGLGSPDARSKSEQIILVETPQVRVGLLVQEVVGVHRLAVAGLDRNFDVQDWSAGVAEGTIVLLDLERLLDQEKLDVFDEVV